MTKLSNVLHHDLSEVVDFILLDHLIEHAVLFGSLLPDSLLLQIIFFEASTLRKIDIILLGCL